MEVKLDPKPPNYASPFLEPVRIDLLGEIATIYANGFQLPGCASMADSYKRYKEGEFWALHVRGDGGFSRFCYEGNLVIFTSRERAKAFVIGEVPS